MKLRVNNCWTSVEASAEELAWLRDYLTCQEKTFQQGRYGQENQWHTHDVSLFEGGIFPSGVLAAVRKRAAADGVALAVTDERQRPLVTLEPWPSWLRDYQRDAAERALGFGRGVLRIPMSGGKSEVFVALTLRLPVEWLYLVKKTDLVRQTAERYVQWTGEQAGTIKAGEWTRGTSNATVAGFDAWWAALKKGAPCVRELADAIQALNVDECHTVSAETLYRGTLALPNAYYRIGQSGTPMHRGDLDNLRVMGALGPVVYNLPTQDLIEQGVIAKSTVRMVACHQDVPEEKHATTWRGVYGQFVVRSKLRNEKVAEIAQAAQKPCLVFVTQLKHGRAVLEECRARGLKADFVYGEASPGKRKRAVQRLVDGELDVLIANEIFDTGLDAPEVRSTVNAVGGKAAIGTLQKMGRAMRKKPDGTLDCETWDLDDTGHGWLQRHAEARREVYESEGYDVQMIADLGVLP